MKKFKFSLQTVHDLRVQAQDAAERDLAKANAAVRQAEAQLEEAVQVREDAVDAYAESLRSGTLDATDAALNASYLHALALAELEQKKRIQILEQQATAQQAHVVRLARETEATANLRERHHARHKAEAARAEQNLLDEIATLNAARRHTLNL